MGPSVKDALVTAMAKLRTSQKVLARHLKETSKNFKAMHTLSTIELNERRGQPQQSQQGLCHRSVVKNLILFRELVGGFKATSALKTE